MCDSETFMKEVDWLTDLLDTHVTVPALAILYKASNSSICDVMAHLWVTVEAIPNKFTVSLCK